MVSSMKYSSRYYLFLCIILISIGLNITGSVFAEISGRGWEIETIDAPRKFTGMSDRSLCVDSQGRPHIAFGEDHMYHAWLDGEVWMIETVDYSPGVGEEASIAIDPSGDIYIAYYDGINDALKCAFNEGEGWFVETVDTEGGHYPSVAVEECGIPHIAYRADDLNYAVRIPDGWEIQVVETDIAPGGFTSLALDAAANAHISHYDLSNDELMYTYHSPSGWSTEVVDNSSYDTGWYSSIFVDADGLPHISYYDRGDRTVAYAVRTESGWQIHDLGERGNWTSLVLDDTGTPHVVFCGTSEIVYSFHDGSTWMFEEIDASAYHASIALDHTGNPVISYEEFSSFEDRKELRYAFKNQGIWEVEIVTSAGDVGTYSALEIDAMDQLHVCYVNSINGHIRYALSSDRGWAIAEPDLKGVDLDLAIDEDGYPHISYLDEDEETVNYLYRNDQGWQVDIVEEDIGFNAFTSIALDSDNRPHLAYRDYRVLRYATKSDTGWVVEILGPQGEYTSIAVDSDDNPHIGYQSWEGDGMAYAHHDGTDWYFESADPDGEAGLYNSMVLDQAGYPHLTYFDNLPDDIRYAFKDETGWHVEIVDEEWDVGKYTSLALDSNGNPRVSYFYGMDVDLRFGYRQDDVWNTYTIVSEGRVGGWSQLVLDSQDRPHVVYYSESAGDLMYAHSDVVAVHENGVISAIPGSIKLLKISPMPVRTGATITYHLGSAVAHSIQQVHLDLYDSMGRRIRSWDYEQLPGEYSVSLPLPTAKQGGPVSGVYYLKADVENGSGQDIKPVIVIH